MTKKSSTNRSVFSALRIVARDIINRVGRSDEPDHQSEREIWNRLDAAQVLFLELRTAKGGDLLKAVRANGALRGDLSYAITLLEARLAQFSNREDPMERGLREGAIDRFQRLRPADQENELACLTVSSCFSDDLDRKRRVRDYADQCANDESASAGAIAMTGKFGPILDQGLDHYVDREHLYRRLAAMVDPERDYALFGELASCTRSLEAWSTVVQKLDTIEYELIERHIVALPYSTERILGLLGHKHRLYARPLAMCMTRVAAEVVRDFGLGQTTRGVHIDHVLNVVHTELVGGVVLKDQRVAIHRKELSAVSAARWKLYELVTRFLSQNLSEVSSEIDHFIQGYQQNAAGPNLLDEYQALDAFVSTRYQPREARKLLRVLPEQMDEEAARKQEILLTMLARLSEVTGDNQGAQELYAIAASDHDDVENAAYAIVRARGLLRVSTGATRTSAQSVLLRKLQQLGKLVVGDTVRNMESNDYANPRRLCGSIDAQLRSEQSLIVNEHRATGRELQRLRFELEEQIGVRRRQEQRLMEERMALINEVQGLLVRLRQVDEINVRELQQQLLAMLRFIRDLLDGRYTSS